MTTDERKNIELTTVHSALLEEEAPPLSEEKFREDNGFKSVQLQKRVWDVLRENVVCDKACVLNLFPILKWLPRYSIKENLMFDVVAGLTVSVLQIPHGLAFAPLAHQQPVVGLYMAVFPIIAYVVLGTSRHLSLGMMGILIMMVGAVVSNHAVIDAGVSFNDTSIDVGAAGYSALEVAVTVTFTVGLWQCVLGILQLGSLCVLLSSSLVSGLTTAAAFQIIAIQLKNFFGISIVMARGPFKLFYIFYEVVINLPDTNYVALLTAVSFFVVLMVFNEWVKPLVAKKSRIPIPMEFILIGLSIIISEFLNLEKMHNVKTVGSVPSGMPEIIMPVFALMPSIILDSLVIALVSISFNISLGKVFAKKGAYEIHDNQELVAYGASNIVGSFFQCLPVSASLSRSMVQFAVGGKTELAHAISLISVLLMLLFMGFLFAKVPLCVLAAIVMATLKGLLVQILDLPRIWHDSKMDGMVWIITFLSVVILDLDYGIGIGLIASITTLLVRGCYNDVLIVNQALSANRCLDSKTYGVNTSKTRILILKIVGDINFFNCSKVSEKLWSEVVVFRETLLDKEAESFIVIDVSTVPSIDPSAAGELAAVVQGFLQNNCKTLLTGCLPNVYDVLNKCSFFDKFPKKSVIVNTHAAVEYLNDKKLS